MTHHRRTYGTRRLKRRGTSTLVIPMCIPALNYFFSISYSEKPCNFFNNFGKFCTKMLSIFVLSIPVSLLCGAGVPPVSFRAGAHFVRSE